MLTYLERLLLLDGVPTIHVAQMRVHYLPAAVALLAIGLGLILVWLLISRRRDLHEAASGLQVLVLGVTVLLLGLDLPAAANFSFLVFLFVVFTVVLLALFNFKGLGNDSLLALKVRRRQWVAYAVVVALALGAYAIARALLPADGSM